MKKFTEAWRDHSQIELAQVHDVEMKALWDHCMQFERALFVEIGSAHGRSATVLAEAALNTGSQVVCIDSFPEDYYGQPKFGDYARREFHKNVLEKFKNVHLLDMTSKEAAEGWKLNEEISVLFVDGDHSYEGVSTDCQLWLPRVASGGYVGFHDYNNVAFDGVKRAADMYTKDWPLTDTIWNLIIRKKP
jgi:cephalosporin hydroxylase